MENYPLDWVDQQVPLRCQLSVALFTCLVLCVVKRRMSLGLAICSNSFRGSLRFRPPVPGFHLILRYASLCVTKI